MTEQLPATPQTEAQRRTARIAGWWFAITFVTSIPALLLYQPLLKHISYVFGSGGLHAGGIALGATLEVFLAISGIATASSASFTSDSLSRISKTRSAEVSDRAR